MKKVLLMAVAMFAASTMFAQKGGLWLGGSLGFSSETEKTDSDKDDKWNNFTIAPFAEYYFMEDVSLFGGIDYAHYKYKKFNPDSDVKGNTFGLFIGAAKYFKLGEKCNLYAAARIGFDTEKDPMSPNQPGTTKATNFNVTVYPGISYQIADKAIIFAELGQGLYFNKHTEKYTEGGEDHKYHDNAFGFNVLTGGVNFGVKFKLM